MPGDFPIRDSGLVEGDGLDGDGFRREMAGADQLLLEDERGFPDGGMIEQAALARTVALEKGVSEFFQFFRGDGTGEDGETLVLENH